MQSALSRFISVSKRIRRSAFDERSDLNTTISIYVMDTGFISVLLLYLKSGKD